MVIQARCKRRFGWMGLLFALSSAQATDFVVTSSSDFQSGNLGSVLALASATPGPHTITFDPAILPATFTLTSSNRQTINYDLTMTGPGADRVTIDFGGFSPGFEVPAGRTVVFSGIKFANARAAGPGGTPGSFSAQPTAGGAAEGGAIRNSGNLTVTNCVFESCKVRGGDGGNGAQFTNQQGQPAGAARGGAIYSNGTSLTVTGCLFFDNDATGGNGGRGASDTQGGQFSFGGGGGTGGSGQGGAIYVAAGTTSITRSTFSSQTVRGGSGGAGGQFSNTSGSGTNPGGAGANAEGGAIFAASALSLIHCTVAHGLCRSGDGGSSGFPLFAASGEAAGAGVSGAGTVTIGNTLVAMNRGAVGLNPQTRADVSGSFSSQGYNLIGVLPVGVAGFTGGTELTGTTASPLDPKLPTSPAPNGFAVSSLRLLPGSPAVDKGKALGDATVDQRGLARTVDLSDVDFPNAVGGDGTDIGAFESQTLPNSQPNASGGFYTITAGQALSGVSVFASDEDFDPLTYSIVGTPLPAGLTLNNDGTITGSTNEMGFVTYQFKVNDGKEDSEVASLTLSINEAPSLVVNTLTDEVSTIDGLTSLREAVALAQTDGLTTPVTFDPVFFATPKSTNPLFSDISIAGDVEIVGPTAGVSLTGMRLSISGGTVALSKLTFKGGTSSLSAPYLQVGGTANVTVTGCTFGDGQFSSSSLPLVNNGGTVTLRNCTIAGNDVTTSGSTASALYQITGTLLLENCTVAANLGTNAIEIAGGTVSMANTLVAGNRVAAGGTTANQIKGAVTSLGHNLIGAAPDMTLSGTTTGNQLGVANPLLDPDGLDSNGGPTPTIALLPGSPARNAGVVLSPPLTSDQRGFPILGLPDIGAFEAQIASIPFTATNEGTPTLVISFNAGTVGTLSASSSLPGLFSDFVFGGSGANSTLTVTPIANQVGVATITVTDSLTGEAQSFVIELVARTLRPDVAVGKSPSALIGQQVYGGRQQVGLVSSKARPVTGHARISNRGNRPDAISVRGTPGTALFNVTYFAPANVTAAMRTGNHRTPALSDGAGASIRIAIKPNLKKLTVKKGRRTTILRKSLTLSITGRSTFNPALSDAASLKVDTR